MNRNSAISSVVLAVVLLIVFGLIALNLVPQALATIGPAALNAIGVTIGVGVGFVAVIAAGMIGLSAALRASVYLATPVASTVVKAAKKYDYEGVTAVLAAASSSGTALAAIAAGLVTPTLEIVVALSATMVLVAGLVIKPWKPLNIAVGLIFFAISPLVLLGAAVLGKSAEETIVAIQNMPAAAVLGLVILGIVVAGSLILAFLKDREDEPTDGAEMGGPA